MKWTKLDLEQYIQAKAYVDTLIVPLIPVHFSADASLNKDAFQYEVLSASILELEQELTGRVMLSPDYHYLTSASKKAEAERINTWVDDALSQPFHHLFFITADSGWKKFEKDMKGTLIWLPQTVTASMQTSERESVISSQTQQLSDLIRSFWNDGQ